ncbi:MAG: hypothetical protein KC656_26520 [Myxococcales bacterium]|nr:hypothetical protein [Myxococcales bacterium]
MVSLLAGDVDRAARHFAAGAPYDGGVGVLVVAAARGDWAAVDAARGFVTEPLRLPRVTRFAMRWVAELSAEPGLSSWAARLSGARGPR